MIIRWLGAAALALHSAMATMVGPPLVGGGGAHTSCAGREIIDKE